MRAPFGRLIPVERSYTCCIFCVAYDHVASSVAPARTMNIIFYYQQQYGHTMLLVFMLHLLQLSV